MSAEWPDWIVKPNIAPNLSQWQDNLRHAQIRVAIWPNVRGANTLYTTAANDQPPDCMQLLCKAFDAFAYLQGCAHTRWRRPVMDANLCLRLAVLWVHTYAQQRSKEHAVCLHLLATTLSHNSGSMGKQPNNVLFLSPARFPCRECLHAGQTWIPPFWYFFPWRCLCCSLLGLKWLEWQLWITLGYATATEWTLSLVASEFALAQVPSGCCDILESSWRYPPVLC